MMRFLTQRQDHRKRCPGRPRRSPPEPAQAMRFGKPLAPAPDRCPSPRSPSDLWDGVELARTDQKSFFDSRLRLRDLEVMALK